MKIGHLGAIIWDILKICEDFADDRPVPMAAKGIFPLPASGIPLDSPDLKGFLRATLGSLNSMHGVPIACAKNQTALPVVKRLESALERTGILDATLPFTSFDDFFRHRNRILLMGRWTAVKTAKLYLNAGLALLADIQIPNSLLKPFHPLFTKFIKSPPKLEPDHPSKKAISKGGRGKRQKRGKKC